jgi:glucokinase
MLALDLGGTRLKAARVQGRSVGPVMVREHGATTRDEALSVLVQVVGELGGGSVSLCLPGIIDGGRVVTLPGKFAGLEGFDLASWLLDLTGRPALVVNDAIAYGLGEAADEPGRTLVVTIGTGIGVAVVENGRPLGSGPYGGGQLSGQVPLTADGPTDTSGRAGTLEGWCRAAQIVQQVAKAGGSAATVQEALAAARAGEPAAVQGISTYRGWLARGLAALCLAHGPDLVVIGGGPVSEDVLLIEGLAELVQPLLWARQHARLRVAARGDTAALHGLAVLAS